jgi:hypothetical protein
VVLSNPFLKRLEFIEMTVPVAMQKGLVNNSAIFNPFENYNGRPVLCQLFCHDCRADFGGAWRNDWLVRKCSSCGNYSVLPVIDYPILVETDFPQGAALN